MGASDFRGLLFFSGCIRNPVEKKGCSVPPLAQRGGGDICEFLLFVLAAAERKGCKKPLPPSSQQRGLWARTGHGLKILARAGPGFFTFSPGRAGLSPRAGPAGRTLKRALPRRAKKLGNSFLFLGDWG